MTWRFAGYDVMPKRDDDSVSPYLRRRLRSYAEVACEKGEDSRPEDRPKGTGPGTRDPADETADDA